MEYQFYRKVTFAVFFCVCFLFLELSNIFFAKNTSEAYARGTELIVPPSSTTTQTRMQKPEAKPVPTVILVSQPSSYTDPSSIIAIAAVIVQAVSLGFVVKYVRDTAKMAKATQESADATRHSAEAAENTLQEMRVARDEENAPFVVVYFNYVHSKHTIYLVVENIGKSVARNVRLKFSPPLQVSKFNMKEVTDNILLTKGIHSIVPNYKIPIPFDYLEHYFHENLPTEYMVKVTYDDDMLTIRKPLEYVLDLNHYKYTHFVTETGLGEIDETLGRLADNLNNYTSTSETTNSVLNEIANAISTGIIIKSQVLVSQSNPDISTKLKEFVLIWTLDYGKRTEKLTKTFLSGLRVRCALLSEGLLKDIVNDGIQEWTNEIKIIIDKMSELGTMNLSFYGPVGWYSSASIFLHDRGNSIENFNNLGDNIVEDIKSVLEIIQSEDIEKKGNQVKKAIVDRVSEQEQFTSQILPPAME